MRKVFESIIEALKYPFRDWKNIIVIGFLLLIASLGRKLPFPEDPQQTVVFIGALLILFLQTGYGSKIVYSGLKGENIPPKLRPIPKLIWEGFKKIIIIIIYVHIMVIFISVGKTQLSANNIPIAIILFVLGGGTYLLMVGGLLNRYFHHGKFIKAFYLKEIIAIIKKIGFWDMISIVICAMISQTLTISTFINLVKDMFTSIELVLCIIAFFLAPIALMSTKRLISLNLRRILSSDEDLEKFTF